ncbi:MAG TPA: YciI family protein, partial [Acidimicrobiales bacterium]
MLSRTLKQGSAKQPHYEAHREWLEAQHRAGRALFSGPTADDTYGIYVLLASTLAEARALAAQDPYHQLGDRELEQLLEWSPRRAMRMDGPTIAELEAMARGNTEGQ